MSHVRQQIREAAASALIAADTGARDNVYSSLVFASEQQQLPLIHVHIEEEESELVTLGGTLMRTAALQVTATASADEYDIDNELDTLAAEIEAAIGGNTFSGITKQTVLTGTELSRATEGSRPTAAITLTFSVEYHTDDSNAEVAL